MALSAGQVIGKYPDAARLNISCLLSWFPVPANVGTESWNSNEKAAYHQHTVAKVQYEALRDDHCLDPNGTSATLYCSTTVGHARREIARPMVGLALGFPVTWLKQESL